MNIAKYTPFIAITVIVGFQVVGVIAFFSSGSDRSAQKADPYELLKCDGKIFETSRQTVVVECNDGRSFSFSSYKYNHSRHELNVAPNR